MTGRKLLIDTNVFIGLEDQKEVAPELAAMVQQCNQYGVHIFIHEAALDDIKRDKDVARRRVSLSKVNKFEQLKGIPIPPGAELIARFGQMPKPNDIVDVALMHALDIGAVDFVITQDQGIHSRAKRCNPSLEDRVLFISDAIAWLRASFEPAKVKLPFIEELPAHAIPLTDEIFDSLRNGYPGFDDWWRKKCVAEHRPCWVATLDGELAGIIVRKEETPADITTKHQCRRILKICTFKVKPKFRGEKLGELLLKQTLWFAQKNDFDLVYLTTFPDQATLISVLQYFGFEHTNNNELGEQIYEKQMSSLRLVPNNDDNLFDLARTHYPRFVGRQPAEAFCVPIKGDYHNILFPELAARVQEDLFAPMTTSNSSERMPGNTIRKVYLCRAPTNQLRPGSVLVFYRSLSHGYIASQSVTSVGVVESVTSATSLEELVRLTGKRSVYSEEQLADFKVTKMKPVKVIDFLLIGHIDPPVVLSDLNATGVFNGSPPQSICILPPARFKPVRNKIRFGFQI
jgi:predicted GNAT family N-acyltransferase